MGDIKFLKKISKNFIDNKKFKLINKIKNKEEKIALFENSLISRLRIKHLDLELKIKKISNKNIKHIITLKSNLIPPKLNLLQTNFNEKDFKKIDSLLNKLEEEIDHV